MDATLRIAQITDLDTVLVLMEELFHEDRLPDQRAFDSSRARSALRDLVSDPSLGTVLLVCDGNAVVGYLALTFGYSLEFHGRDAFIDELYIRPTHRGRGFGTQVMARVESVARSEHIRAIHLEVGRENTALDFYRRMGYVSHERYLMTKWLDERV